MGIFKWVFFECTKLSIHFESFNDECAIMKEAKDANLLIQEPKLTRVNLKSINDRVTTLALCMSLNIAEAVFKL